MNDTTRQIGGALGVAIIGSIVSTMYRRSFHAPIGLPGGALDAARESVGRAAIVAGNLPVDVGIALKQAANEAFIHAVKFGYWTSAAVLAITVIFVRRNVASTGLSGARPGAPTPEPVAD